MHKQTFGQHNRIRRPLWYKNPFLRHLCVDSLLSLHFLHLRIFALHYLYMIKLQNYDFPLYLANRGILTRAWSGSETAFSDNTSCSINRKQNPRGPNLEKLFVKLTFALATSGMRTSSGTLTLDYVSLQCVSVYVIRFKIWDTCL